MNQKVRSILLFILFLNEEEEKDIENLFYTYSTKSHTQGWHWGSAFGIWKQLWSFLCSKLLMLKYFSMYYILCRWHIWKIFHRLSSLESEKRKKNSIFPQKCVKINWYAHLKFKKKNVEKKRSNYIDVTFAFFNETKNDLFFRQLVHNNHNISSPCSYYISALYRRSIDRRCFKNILDKSYFITETRHDFLSTIRIPAVLRFSFCVVSSSFPLHSWVLIAIQSTYMSFEEKKKNKKKKMMVM